MCEQREVLRRERLDTDAGLEARDDEHVHGGTWRAVPEGQHVLVLVKHTLRFHVKVLAKNLVPLALPHRVFAADDASRT
jgi:hypothetical protein